VKKFKACLLITLCTVILCAATVFTGCTEPDPYPPVEDVPGYRLVWRDEFMGNSLDESKWEFQTGIGSHPPSNAWGNAELQYYKRDNVSVSNGTLKITAKRERTDFMYRDEPFHQEFTSARIRTKGKFSQMYGRFEARISLPAGVALWPAFWMMPEPVNPEVSEHGAYGGWPRSGEIDIMEARGRITDRVAVALHYGTAPGIAGHKYSDRYHILGEGRSIQHFNIYRVDWHEDYLEWFVNGVKIFEVNSDVWFTSGATKQENPRAPFDQEFHMLLNLAIGGMFDGMRTPPPEFTSAVMEVDYVRVWQAESRL